MKNWMSKSIGFLGLSLILSMGPVLQGVSLAQPAPAKDSKATKSSSAKASEETAAPSDKENCRRESEGNGVG